MTQMRIPAAFYRGGTSNAVVFNAADLPPEKAIRDAIFLHIMGSPDPYGRQLNGMGGGISSLSKVVIVEPSRRGDADVDYTFVQIAVDKPIADYGSMCGNMSSAVGPFAVDEGIVDVEDGEVTVRVYNTNTDKIYHASFTVVAGKTVEEGDFEIPGVPGTGARIQLDYLSPGGSATGKLLPSGNVKDTLQIPGFGELEVSLVDASNPIVYVRATDLGCSAMEMPQDLDNQTELMGLFDQIRRLGGVAMGLADKPEDVALSNPKFALVAAAGEYQALDGRVYNASDYEIATRMVSMGKVHRAVMLTGAMCLATAVRIPGTIPNEHSKGSGTILVGNPSGLLPVEADVFIDDNGSPQVRSVTTFRTQRRMMEGSLLFPGHLLKTAAL